ncbi:TPA: hypothetical protein MAK97_001346 [Klebsiella variicola]|uniref:hypothetical protein n=1 Tax=Klebsiella variicola TaxID=244366 RepID=UPI0007A5EDAC|nr:hypothetical protein [Klebsiella variicola]HBS5904814.1 hypothetical protein [Klebsiella variicola]
MSESLLCNKDISELVKSRLKSSKWTLRDCVDIYNERRKYDASLQEVPELNKDFLLRVKNNNFEVTNLRVVKLCDFFDIPVNVSGPRRVFQKEFARVEALVEGDPALRSRISALLMNIADLAEQMDRADR